MRFWQWVGRMLRIHRAGKGPWGCWGWGLGSMEHNVSESGDPHLGAQQAPQAQLDGANALCSSPASPGRPLPPASPDLPGLRGTDPVWSPLFLLPQSHHILLAHLGVPPVSLCIRVPHQQLAGTSVVGRS